MLENLKLLSLTRSLKIDKAAAPDLRSDTKPPQTRCKDERPKGLLVKRTSFMLLSGSLGPKQRAEHLKSAGLRQNGTRNARKPESTLKPSRLKISGKAAERSSRYPPPPAQRRRALRFPWPREEQTHTDVDTSVCICQNVPF